MADEVRISQSELIAVSRLLWEIGNQETTSHRHKVDCFHWGAVLDHRSGLPPSPTPGNQTDDVIAFYERIELHLRDVITGLREANANSKLEPDEP